MTLKTSHPSGQSGHLSGVHDTWLKASVAGSLWASSEIILGSFLHNLHVPFSSIILTGIGLTLMIATSYRWNDRGLIWRAGVICALMKAVSPSAVILGPMVAILSQAFILEFFVRILGRNIAGFIAGSVVAMSWNFVQKMINFVIYYGFTIVDLYTMMVKYAEKQLHITFFSLWAPLIVLWLVYFVAGSVAAVTGIYLGRTSQGEGPVRKRPMAAADENRAAGKTAPAFSFSLAWLIGSLGGIVAVLVMMNRSGPAWWITGGVVLSALWIIRYRHTLRRLAKPKFWIFFIIITMLSGFLLSGAGNGTGSIIPGLLEGFRMNFRAALMILGFSVIGKELRNPVIRTFFTRRSFRQLPLALELSFSILPGIISSLPPMKAIVRNPVPSLRDMVSQADRWLDRIRLQLNPRSGAVIIEGEKGEGKSTFAAALADELKRRGVSVSGILSPAIFTAGERTGYAIENVHTGQQEVLARRVLPGEQADIGEWVFADEGFAFGTRALSFSPEASVFIVDEAGRWELSGGGWDAAVTRLILTTDVPLVVVVNKKFTEQIIRYWNFSEPMVFSATLMVEEVADAISPVTVHPA